MEYEVLDVIQDGLTTSHEKGEVLTFLNLKTLLRGEEKCFYAKSVSDDKLNRIIGKAQLLKAVEIRNRNNVPMIVAIGDNGGENWIVVLSGGRCVYTTEKPEEFLEQYKDRFQYCLNWKDNYQSKTQ